MKRTLRVKNCLYFDVDFSNVIDWMFVPCCLVQGTKETGNIYKVLPPTGFEPGSLGALNRWLIRYAKTTALLLKLELPKLIAVNQKIGNLPFVTFSQVPRADWMKQGAKKMIDKIKNFIFLPLLLSISEIFFFF